MIFRNALKYLLCFVLISCQNEDTPEINTLVYVQKIDLQVGDFAVGKTSQITAIISPDNATDQTLIWHSSDETIATVSANGVVTALKNGAVSISATAKDKGTITASKVIIISSFGTTTANYVVSTSIELVAAIAKIKAGETIEMNPGTYLMSSKITIVSSGTEEKRITLKAKEGAERPKLDFSSMSENSSNQGVVLKGSYWHLKGIDIFHAGDNGLQITGSNNTVEFMTFSECSDTGLQIDNGAANNTILNCDSYFNADSSLENADGFACKLTAGTGNKFIGCRAWQNLDDGWDGYLRGTENITTTYENCWAIKNGYLKTGAKGAGDGNGFKTGGSDDKMLKHNAIYTNCVAVGNVADGFDHNSNRGEVLIYNCSAYDNGKNYSFSSTNPLAKLIIKNSNVLGSYGSTNATTTDISYNSWDSGLTVSTTDFKAIDYKELLGARKADGSLPDIIFFHLTTNSSMMNKGIDVGLPYTGAAPDLGAFEN